MKLPAQRAIDRPVGRAQLEKGREIKFCKKRLDAMSDEMTLALGAFVTEVGDVEYVMFETILAVAEKEPNEVHRAFYNERPQGDDA
jgi:hypothetical protein